MTWKKFKMEASAAYNKRKFSNDYGSGYTGSYIYDMIICGGTEYAKRNGVKVVSGSVKRDIDGNILENTRIFALNDAVVSYESYISKYYDLNNNPSRQNVLCETFFKLRNV